MKLCVLMTEFVWGPHGHSDMATTAGCVILMLCQCCDVIHILLYCGRDTDTHRTRRGWCPIVTVSPVAIGLPRAFVRTPAIANTIITCDDIVQR